MDQVSKSKCAKKIKAMRVAEGVYKVNQDSFLFALIIPYVNECKVHHPDSMIVLIQRNTETKESAKSVG